MPNIIGMDNRRHILPAEATDDADEIARRRRTNAQREYRRRLRRRGAPRPEAVEAALCAAVRAWIGVRDGDGGLPKAEAEVVRAIFMAARDHLTAAGYDRDEVSDRLFRAMHPRRLPPRPRSTR